jgi:hypothetical protein
VSATPELVCAVEKHPKLMEKSSASYLDAVPVTKAAWDWFTQDKS